MEWSLRRPNDIRGPWGPKVSWHLSYRWGKTPKKNLTQETCPDRESNPGPLHDKRACYHLLHRGGSVYVPIILNQQTLCYKSQNKYRIARDKFYPGSGLEPEPLAFRANAILLSYLGQVRIHDRINLLELSFLTSGLTNCVVTMSHGGTHSLLNDN